MKSKKTSVASAFALALLSLTARADTHYVDPSGGDVPPYTSWPTAARNIQDAVDAATAGDLVLATNGLYTLASEISVGIGISVASVNGAAATTVDAAGAGRAFILQHADAALSGFTITGGLTNYGGGVYLDQGGSVSNCVVTNCATDTRGGAVYCYLGGLVRDCSFIGNASSFGGAVYCRDGGIVENTWLQSNIASNRGGGVYIHLDGEVRNSVMVSNQTARGGGVYCNAGGSVESCTISRNEAVVRGGGIYCLSGGGVENSIVFGNDSPLGPEHYNAGGGMQYDFVCTWPAVPGSGNLAVDPEFTDPDALDFRLPPGSPCLDSGTNRAWMATLPDIDGTSRILNGVVDIGAYERAEGALQARAIATATAGVSPFEAVVSAHVGGTNLAGLQYWWDVDGDAVFDAPFTGLGVVTNTYTGQAYHSLTLVVSNGVGEGAVSPRVDYIRTGLSPLYVADGGSHTLPFTTWDDAATNIQDAVDAAVHGATVIISNGAYALTSTVTIAKGVSVQALAAGDVTIVGDDSNGCFFVSHPDAVLDGLAITRGRAALGGGVYVYEGGTVRSCTVSNNVASDKAGGVYLFRGGELANCRVLDNAAGVSAGGIRCYYGGTVRNSIIAENSTIEDGGGLYGYYGGLVDACVVSNNYSTIDGGGISCLATALVFNCLVIDNTAETNGGGVHISGAATLGNGTVVSNTANATGGGIYVTAGGSLRDSIVYFNTAPVSNNIFADGGSIVAYTDATPLPAGTGNIASDPLFADAAGGDYRLTQTSPAIDAADPAATTTTDRLGAARPLDGDTNGAPRHDMGAYEFVHPRSDSDGDCMWDAWELLHGLSPTNAADALDNDDGDRHLNWQEFYAGTDPGVATNVLAMTITLSPAATDLVVGWPAATNRLFTLQAATNAAGTWTNIAGQVDRPGLGAPMTHTNAGPQPSAVYRVKAALPD